MRGAGNGPGLALLTGGAAAAAARRRPSPPRRGGLREERSRGLGRRKREPGPAGCERAEERNATDCQAGRSGRRADSEGAAAVSQPHKGPRLGPSPPQGAGLEPASAGARGERGAGGHGWLRAGSAAGQPQPGEGVRAGVRGCAGALQRCGRARGRGRGPARRGPPSPLQVGRPGGVAPTRAPGRPLSCSFSGPVYLQNWDRAQRFSRTIDGAFHSTSYII